MTQSTEAAQPRAIVVQDISCVGRCSLTVALPVLSAAGVNTAVVPTALLSTHTGEFTGYTHLDLSGQLLPIARHIETLGLHFDAFYSGYLASGAQVEMVLEMIGLLCDGDIRRPACGDEHHPDAVWLRVFAYSPHFGETIVHKREFLPHILRRFRRHAGYEHHPVAARHKCGADLGYLLRRLARAVDHLGHALAHFAVVIHLGKAYILKGREFELSKSLLSTQPAALHGPEYLQHVLLFHTFLPLKSSDTRPKPPSASSSRSRSRTARSSCPSGSSSLAPPSSSLTRRSA